MPIEMMIFYAFAGVAVAASMQVIVSANPVRAVLSLIVAFIATAGVWLLLQSEFLAIALILVYVGAVMVLFLFVIMMLDMRTIPLGQRWVRYAPIMVTVVGSLLAMLVFAFQSPHFGLSVTPAPAPAIAGSSDVQAVGLLLYTEYILPLECAGVILLAAMISAIALTFRGPRDARKQQDIDAQVRVTKASRLRIVSVSSRRSQEPSA